MTIEEINRTYIDHRRKLNKPVAAKYVNGSVVPIMPFLVADLVYSIYVKEVSRMDCRFVMAQAKRQWKESYHRFNTEFFQAFSGDQVDQVVDFMDDFEQQIHNSIEIMRIEILGLCPDSIPFDKQMTTSYLILAYVLSWGAIGCWGQCYKTGVKAFKVKNSLQYTFKEETNQDLLRMAKAVHKFTYAYCPELKHQEVDSMDKFYSLWDGVCLNIAEFGYNYKGNTMV